MIVVITLCLVVTRESVKSCVRRYNSQYFITSIQPSIITRQERRL